MARRLNSRNSGRTCDLDFNWVTREFGPNWAAWRGYSAEWIKTQPIGLPRRFQAVRALLDDYLHRQHLPADPGWLLNRANTVPDFFAVCPQSEGGVQYNNTVHSFLDWVLEQHFSELRDDGKPVILPNYRNPFPWRSRARFQSTSESVYTPLPYSFIRELRSILAPGRHFRDWIWAQTAIGAKEGVTGRMGDWFEVDPSVIDRDDPDCVWRERKIRRPVEGRVRLYPVAVTQMWSPARTVALMLKLSIPLRTYQVRMLDSGEADTMRFTLSGWVRNTGPLASGEDRRPARNGVFRRVQDSETGMELTALYINTNKTADIAKSGDALGYVVPWPMGEVHYWLEKLRNWQEKYNPISRPTPWTELELRHLGGAKSQVQLDARPDTCFLFRDASLLGENRAKPLHADTLDRLWHELLAALERRCAARGQVLSDGRPLQFVPPPEKSNKGNTTLFPLHSLRVSILTALAMDGDVSLVVLSKLVAGHSRIVMTLYYQKPGMARIMEALDAGAQRLDACAAEGLVRFLSDQTYEQLSRSIVWNNEDGLKRILPSRPEDRNPAGWMPRHHGLCLAGGNTSAGERTSRIGGCANGGEPVRKEQPLSEHASGKIVHGPVPGGAGNCVRCRWFVTEPRYLDALRAHFNNISYHLGDAARLARQHEEAREHLKTRRVEAEQTGQPFSGESEYLREDRLWETAMARTDQLANDLLATYRLITRCVALLDETRQSGMSQQQLVAVGGLQDVHVGFREVSSELLELAGVCLDAEIYPDETPGKAVIRRSQLLDSALYREGLQPVFMSLKEDEQLRIGNRWLQDLSRLARAKDPDAGLEQVVGVFETGRKLAESGLAENAVELLEASIKRPLVRVSDMTMFNCPRRKLKQH